MPSAFFARPGGITTVTWAVALVNVVVAAGFTVTAVARSNGGVVTGLGNTFAVLAIRSTGARLGVGRASHELVGLVARVPAGSAGPHDLRTGRAEQPREVLELEREVPVVRRLTDAGPPTASGEQPVGDVPHAAGQQHDVGPELGGHGRQALVLGAALRQPVAVETDAVVAAAPAERAPDDGAVADLDLPRRLAVVGEAETNRQTERVTDHHDAERCLPGSERSGIGCRRRRPARGGDEAGAGDDRRDAIARAARSLIVEKGVEGLRTRDIADRVGINIATLHYHVPTKEALIELVTPTFTNSWELLQYLCDGSLQPGEHLLVLPKLLCGLTSL